MKTLSRRVLKGLFDAYPEGVAIAEVGESVSGIVSFNPALQTISGFSSDAILGKSLLFLAGQATNQEALEEVERAVEARIPCSVFLCGFGNDGEAVCFDFDLVPIRDYDLRPSM